MLTSCGSQKISVKIVDSFCETKYYPQNQLNKQDFVNLSEIRTNEKHKFTIDKLTQQLTINEKEFKQCLKDTNLKE
jgi:hypothetical protein